MNAGKSSDGKLYLFFLTFILFFYDLHEQTRSFAD